MLSDADRYGADYLLKCRACGRIVVIERLTFQEIAAAWELPQDVRLLAARLRCEVCQHRGCILELAAPGAPDLLRLINGAQLPPKGFSLTRWLRMPNSERKRYKRTMRS